MGRNPCSSKEGVMNKGAWTAHEDKILSEYVKIHGEGRWRNLPKKAGLNRCGKSCRLRWLNYLRPDIKRGNISPDEEELIIRLHKLLGNRWSLIAGRLPGRTDNEIKNYWNSNLGKKTQDHQISPGGSTRKSTNVETNSISEMSTSNIIISNNNNNNNKNDNNNNHSSSLPSAPSGMATQVFRTKAIKCTKVVVSNDPPPSPPPCLAHNVDHFDPDKHTSPSSLDTHHLSNCYPLQLEANTLNGLSPSLFSSTTTSREDFSSSTDFIMNFNSAEELLLSNVLNSGLFDYYDKYCNNSVLSTSLGDDQDLMFSEDFLMQSWEYY